MKREIEYKGYIIVTEVNFNVEITGGKKYHMVKANVNEKCVYKAKTQAERLIWEVDVSEKLAKKHIDEIVSTEPSIVGQSLLV
jgi:hypothetical protein